MDVLRQIARSLGQTALFAGERLGIVAAGSAALHVLLLADDAVEQIEILADEGLLVLDPLGTVFTEQQLQNGVEVIVDLALFADGIAELLAAQQIDNVLEVAFDAAFAAFLERLLDQRCPIRIGLADLVPHPHEDALQVLEFGSQLLLGSGKVSRGYRRRGRRRSLPAAGVTLPASAGNSFFSAA